VLPAHCPDPFHFIEVITSTIVLLKKVCSIIVAKRRRDLTKVLGRSIIKNEREEGRGIKDKAGGR